MKRLPVIIDIDAPGMEKGKLERMSNTENSQPARVIGRPFAKGSSANPGGRPKLIREFQEWLASECYPIAQEALKGCLRSDDEKVRMLAIKEVHDRLFGKPVQAITGADGEPLIPRLQLASLSPEQLAALDAVRALTDGRK